MLNQKKRYTALIKCTAYTKEVAEAMISELDTKLQGGITTRTWDVEKVRETVKTFTLAQVSNLHVIVSLYLSKYYFLGNVKNQDDCKSMYPSAKSTASLSPK